MRTTTFILLVQSTLLFVEGAKNVRFASPLQSLTIWDPEAKESKSSQRDSFLPKYETGLKAENDARLKLSSKNHADLQNIAVSSDDGDWSKKAAALDKQKRQRQEAIVEKVYDRAIQNYEQQKIALPDKVKKNSNDYQFVGVVKQKPTTGGGGASDDTTESIKWYARKKPSNANWSVRLVHVNTDAIITDLFRRGKVDIFASYKNTGEKNEETNAPIVKSQYHVVERSWRTLWNFGPKHFFTDSSGMYWRERRLRPGMYSDGNTVYESSYRYGDGRNGMHRLSSFQAFLNSKSINNKTKQKAMKHLKDDSPDIVLEE